MNGTVEKTQLGAGWRLGVSWLLATAGGLGLAVLLAIVIGRVLSPLAGIGLIGTVFGIAQWFILRGQLRRAGWWVLASAVGWVAACVSLAAVTIVLVLALEGAETRAPDAPQNAAWIALAALAIAGTVIGSVMGTAQWLFLRRRIGRAGWWIVASATAWAAGIVLVIPVAGPLQLSVWDVLSHRITGLEVALTVILALGVGAVMGALTGALLAKPAAALAAMGHSWKETSTLAQALAILGLLLFALAAGLGLYLTVTRFGASFLEGNIKAESAGSCSHPLVGVLADRKTISKNESLDLTVILENDESRDCEFTVRIDAPRFNISPPQATQTIALPAGETARLVWVVAPTEVGTYRIGFGCALDSQSIGICVTNVLGLKAEQAQILAGIGTFLGPAFTFPWIYATWQQRRKEKKEKQETETQDLRRQAELQDLRRQVEELKAQQKTAKWWQFWK